MSREIWDYKDVRNYIWSLTDSKTLFLSTRPVCKQWKNEAWNQLLKREIRIEKTAQTSFFNSFYSSFQNMNHSLFVIKLSETVFVPTGSYIIKSEETLATTNFNLKTKKQTHFFGNGKRDRDSIIKDANIVSYKECPAGCNGYVQHGPCNHRNVWDVKEPPHKMIKKLFSTV